MSDVMWAYASQCLSLAARSGGMLKWGDKTFWANWRTDRSGFPPIGTMRLSSGTSYWGGVERSTKGNGQGEGR